MISPTKWILKNIKPWWFKCFKNKCQRNLPRQIWSYFAILKFLGLIYVILILECVQGLYKFAQTWDTFIFILWLLSRIVKGMFIGCIVTSKQGMGIMTFDSLWTLWTIIMMFYIMFGLLDQFQDWIFNISVLW